MSLRGFAAKSIRSVLTLGALYGFVGCGGQEGAEFGFSTSAQQIPQPRIDSIAPSQVSAGDTVTVYGEDFCDPSQCKVRFTFNGTYQSDTGTTETVHHVVDAANQNPREAKFTFGPDIPFSQLNQTGVFRGTIVATNVGFDGEIVPSVAPYNDAQLTVGPSIIANMRPVDTDRGCTISGETSEQTKVFLDVTAVGLTPPLTFLYGLDRSAIDIESGSEDANLPESGYYTLVEQNVTDPHRYVGAGSAVDDMQLAHGNGTDPLGPLGSILDMVADVSSVDLLHLRTLPPPHQGDLSHDTTIVIRAVDGQGREAVRSLPLRISNPVVVYYNGSNKVMRCDEPRPVTACIPGTTPAVVSEYSENEVDTRTRDYRIRAETGLEAELKTQIDLFVIEAESRAMVRSTFGVEVGTSASSSKATANVASTQIFVNEWGVWYRQVCELQLQGEAYFIDACGTRKRLGDVVVSDWVWGAGMEKSFDQSCPPFPPPRAGLYVNDGTSAQVASQTLETIEWPRADPGGCAMTAGEEDSRGSAGALGLVWLALLAVWAVRRRNAG